MNSRLHTQFNFILWVYFKSEGGQCMYEWNMWRNIKKILISFVPAKCRVRDEVLNLGYDNILLGQSYLTPLTRKTEELG
jgi:hypothetical protein